MTIETALERGYLELNDDEAGVVLESLFNVEDAQKRLEDGLQLMSTFIPPEKLGAALDLASIVIDTYEELEAALEGHDHGDGCNCGHEH